MSFVFHIKPVKFRQDKLIYVSLNNGHMSHTPERCK